MLLLEFAPQPLRILRTRSISGISMVGSGVAFGSELGWLVFGVIEGLVVVVVTAGITAVFTGMQFVLVLPNRKRGEAGWVGLWAVVLVVAFAVGSLGAVLVIAVLVSMGPQVWTVWRSDDVSGVSAARWAFGGLSGLLWGTYGLLLGQFTLVGSGVVALTCSVAVLVRLARGRRLGPSDPVGPPDVPPIPHGV